MYCLQNDIKHRFNKSYKSKSSSVNKMSLIYTFQKKTWLGLWAMLNNQGM